MTAASAAAVDERNKCIDILMAMAEKTKADALALAGWTDLYRSLGERYKIIIECAEALKKP